MKWKPIQQKIMVGISPKVFDQYSRQIKSIHYSELVFKYSAVNLTIMIKQWLDK